MKKKEFWLLGILIVSVTVIQGWSLLYNPRVIVNTDTIAVDSMSAGEETSCVSFKYPPRTISAAEVEELNLELLGTAIGNTKDPIAFIKDLRTEKQGAYRLGSLIRGAKIIGISMGEVIFDRNGQIEVLRLSNRGKAWCGINQQTSPIFAAFGNQIVISKSALLSENPNLYKTVTNIKIKPHYQSDKVIGLMIDGIPEDSVIKAAGVRNKDIIKTVNSQKINSYQKALQVFQKFRNQSEIKVCLLRDGREKMLCYKIGR